MPDFAPPTKDDLDRSLDRYLEDRFQELLVARSNVMDEFIKAGGFSNSRLPLVIADAFDKGIAAIADDAVERALPYLSAAKDVSELATWIRPHLENLKTKLVSDITGGEGNLVVVQRTYEPKFQQRIDGALQDLEIGIVRGKPFRQARPSTTADTSPVNPGNYVSEVRLVALRAIQSSQVDIRKLIRICEELNASWSQGSYYSITALLRALLDHVPPVFGQTNFAAVVARTGGKSLKEHMRALDAAARNNADLHLHEQIKRRHTLPNATQVDQRAHLDHLLGEIISKLS
jgi:hypothetical protein